MHAMLIEHVVAVPVAYGLGCLSVGYYLVRRRTGADLRTLGSGSTGATNVGRQLGAAGFALTLFGDAGKGALVAVAARWLELTPTTAWSMVLAVVIGHVWPLQLGFRGGKGVATWLGAMVVAAPDALAVLALVMLPTWLVLRRRTLAALIGFAAVPFGLLLLGTDLVGVWYAGALSAVLWFAHRDNLRAAFGNGGELAPRAIEEHTS